MKRTKPACDDKWKKRGDMISRSSNGRPAGFPFQLLNSDLKETLWNPTGPSKMIEQAANNRCFVDLSTQDQTAMRMRRWLQVTTSTYARFLVLIAILLVEDEFYEYCRFV